MIASPSSSIHDNKLVVSEHWVHSDSRCEEKYTLPKRSPGPSLSFEVSLHIIRYKINSILSPRLSKMFLWIVFAYSLLVIAAVNTDDKVESYKGKTLATPGFWEHLVSHSIPISNVFIRQCVNSFLVGLPFNFIFR